MWASLLTEIKKCPEHYIINSRNNVDIIISEYCLDCQKELCLKCKEESHNGNNIKTIKNIVKSIDEYKLKNINFQEFQNF